MKEIRTQDAVGHVLCHDITRILPGVEKGPVFRKGHIVTEEDIPVLLDVGKEHLFVWEKDERMLHENEAAQILYRICAGNEECIRPSEIREGKIELLAACDGILKTRREALHRINSLGEMMIAARPSCSVVRKGDKLAGTRIIPLVIEKEKMERAVEAAGSDPIFRILPILPKKTAILTTGNEVYLGRIEDKFTPVLVEKLMAYGAEVFQHRILPDNPDQITEAILQSVEQGAEMVLCSGGMSVDPDDKTPLAIRNTGARMVSYGAPVLPGAMFLLAYQGSVPIVGLPGCVMYAGRTVFDLVLPRLLADDEITAEELQRLGDGGLCLGCEECHFPNCSFGHWNL